MEYDTKAFFVEKDEPDVKGFVVIDTDDSAGYRMAEKWVRPEAEGGERWLTYWIPEAALEERLAAGQCAYSTQVSEKQFRGLLRLAGVAHQYEVPA